MRDHDLPNRLRRKGLNVQLVGGWELRGSDTFSPYGSINHHTAGSAVGIAPSLNTCIYGRSDVPGPLCHVLQGRHPTDPMQDPIYVIAAGRANHGGQGSWQGLSGNSKYYGLEIEHVGTIPVDQRRLEVAARVHSAFLEGPTASRDAGWTPQHFEYAEPPGRKIDFYNLAPMTAASFRTLVQSWVGRSVGDTPPPPEDDEMYKTRKIGMAPHDSTTVETFAYVLPDGTIVDRDYNGSAIDANNAKKFDVILLGDDERITAGQAAVDQVQQAIKAATQQRHGTL